MKPQLTYILPEYSKTSATHFAHIHDFIRRISAYFDVTLLIEKGEAPAEDWGCKKVLLLTFSFTPLRFLELMARIFFGRLVEKKNVYVHYSFVGAYAAVCVFRFFGGKVFYWNAGEPWKYKKGWFREMFERKVYRAVTVLVTGTEALKKEYARVYDIRPEKIRVMPNWIDCGRFSNVNIAAVRNVRQAARIREHDAVVLFVHRLSKRKGADLLPAIAEAFRDDPVKFLVVGDGPERSALHIALREKHLEDAVIVLGEVPNAGLPSYYGMADLFIMPSEEEGFPRVLLEAMATKTPFVAFNAGAGGVAGIVPPELSEYVIPVGDVPAFIAAMKKILLASPETIMRIKEFEERWVRKFDIGEVVEIFRKMF
ncbi:MAG: hypothetical protein A3C16_05985 [Candidatus Sungbacteria bacterium RIFCSPHIGHO2_02_FULL_51_29]|uniref:Glycosyl transferase family 1 domain-containing protein n=1 Tax=Candidatus Sungbacteria bacterium RIFCSPHIGHO2_02_FULL_51_29 TaxID=1802273 RepID=A0A1G2KQY4_9BACT|nr:MAG: hypothetical protein A3C16_05985 [Candidatus Sungbacteria bacterium RIFCSPHIGHO2_02_FULL_51_29]